MGKVKTRHIIMCASIIMAILLFVGCTQSNTPTQNDTGNQDTPTQNDTGNENTTIQHDPSDKNTTTQHDPGDENTMTQRDVNKKILLKGDLHCHTKYSGSGGHVHTIEETANYVKEAGWDFTAITDHNTKGHFTDKYWENPTVEGIILIPGYEITLSVGHFNHYGIMDFEERLEFKDGKDMEEYLKSLREKGAITQVNHPFCPSFPNKLGMDIDFGGLEVWNGKWGLRNIQALNWWQNALVSGRKIVITGGTDAHGAKSERFPATCVYADERTSEGILTAIQRGNVYITENANTTNIEMICDGAIMGDTVDYRNGLKLIINIENTKPNNILRVYTNEGVEYTRKCNETNFQVELDVEERMFYRQK